MLQGNFDVHCKRCGRTDRVSGITRNHNCEKCGEKTVNDGAALLKCPNCGNIDLVGGVTTQHGCSNCGSQVRR